MKYIECPDTCDLILNQDSVFIAGGIRGCHDWQKEMVSLLADTDLALLNPRREPFPTSDPNAVLEQVKWEYDYLHKATSILFWFPAEIVCSTALYELGFWSYSSKPLYIGVHPEFNKRRTVELQTQLSRPNIEISYSLPELAKQIRQAAT